MDGYLSVITIQCTKCVTGYNKGGELMNDLLDKLNTLDPGGPWGQISGILNRMEIAEDEITEAQSRHPEHSERVWGAFKLLCAPQLSGYPDVIYRAHCVEILDRVANDIDTRLGTKAEVMIACSQASLAHPPSPVVSFLYAHLFSEIFPGKADYEVDLVQDMLAPNAWVSLDDIRELLSDLVHKTRVDTRTLKE